jgi:nucleotide-binding universal stress UspA family protein
MEAEMFKTIVLALDGSHGSRRAVPVAVELAERDQANLVIAHVEQDVAGKGGGPIPATEDEIQAEIRTLAEEISAGGLETTVEMRNIMLGGPAHAIASIAEAADADLIVVGTRGHSSLAGVVLGKRHATAASRRPLPCAGRPAGARVMTNGGRA